MPLTADVVPKAKTETKLSSARLVKPNTPEQPSNGYHKPQPWVPLRDANLPDHTQLPAEDGTFVKNFQEHPQSIMLTTSMEPVLDRLHPDGQYAIGQDSGIYWNLTDPPQAGAESPDWFYVPNRPPTLAGVVRRSYVLWKEITPPLIVIEFVSGNGSEEHDQTPYTGKYWVYENAIKPLYYAIYDVSGGGSNGDISGITIGKGKIELYVLKKQRYELIAANNRKHYPIPELGIELGLWPGTYMQMQLPWLRVWDADGNLLLTGEERAEKERRAKEALLSELERYKAKLRALGVNPDNL